MKKIDTRKQTTEAQAIMRQQAVMAVLSGKTHREVAEIFHVARGTVTMWMSDYKREGEEIFKAGKRGRPKKISLKPVQAAQIVRLIRDKNPDQLKLPFYLWTREAVGLLIERKFNVKLSVWTVGRYLKRWGFTPQKPVRRAFEQNPEEVRQWLEKIYPEIKKNAKRENAEINWCDEMGLRSDCQVGRSYSIKGKTPTIPGTGQRYGFNMISSVTNRGKMRFKVFDEIFSAGIFVEFAERLIKTSSQKIYLIVDRHPVHKSRRVKKWVESNRERIMLFYLPAYSPELNPDEMLNNDVKSNAVGRRRFDSKNEMRLNVRCYLMSTQKMPSVVANYFHAESVRYAAVI
jgi:transposase